LEVIFFKNLCSGLIERKNHIWFFLYKIVDFDCPALYVEPPRFAESCCGSELQRRQSAFDAEFRLLDRGLYYYITLKGRCYVTTTSFTPLWHWQQSGSRAVFHGLYVPSFAPMTSVLTESRKPGHRRFGPLLLITRLTSPGQSRQDAERSRRYRDPVVRK